MFDQFLCWFIIRGSTGMAGEQGVNMSGYLFVTFSQAHIEGGRGKHAELWAEIMAAKK